jgi:putative hydrolase of the HAD superfamily
MQIMTSKSKSIIFDWGGVLMRTEDHSTRHAWDERLGLPHGSVEQVVHGCPWRDAQLGTAELATYWAEVAHQLNLTAAMTADLQRDFYYGDRLDLKLVTLIRQLRAEHHQIGLLSNNILPLLDEMSILGVLDLFDATVISAQIGVMKPAAAAYHAILDVLNTSPSQAAFIDDVAENIAGAQAVGMHGILFTPDLDLESTLREWLNA